MNQRISFWFDALVFQCAWFGCVLATKTSFPIALPILSLALVAVRVTACGRIRQTLPFVAICAFLGSLGDPILFHAELISFKGNHLPLGTSWWMLALWINFGLMLKPIFNWFITSKVRSLIGFSLGGMIAYASGEKLGVLELTTGRLSFLGVGALWSIAGLSLHYANNWMKAPDEPR